MASAALPCCTAPLPRSSTVVTRGSGVTLLCSPSSCHGPLRLGSSRSRLNLLQKQLAKTGISVRRGGSTNVFALFKSRKPQKVVRETVIPDPDYRIPIILLGAAGVSVYSDNLVAAVPLGLLGLLLLVQASRVRFVFEDEALEVKVGDELKDFGENVFVGGKNRWRYSSFVNWEFWWPNFPVLVYFKETQTKPEGQIHFFPIIFNGKQLYDTMVERAGPSQTSGPK